MSDVMKGVKEVIVDVLKVDEKDISLDTSFVEDLKADSMDQFFVIDGFVINSTCQFLMKMPEILKPLKTL
jgi:acyl carrier protein